jgi:dienelactone hydrolase
MQSQYPNLSRRRWLLAGAAGALGLALPLRAREFVPAGALEASQAAAQAAELAASGAAQVADNFAVKDLDWHDAARQRQVPARLYLPTQATAVPMVLFSHGIGGTRLGYSYLGRYLASQGVASLHLQHVGSDRSLWLGNPLTLVSRLHQAAQESEALDRVRDLRFGLDQVLADPALRERIDAHRLVAAGHSYGANTVMLATGARIQRGGRPLALRDDRLQAALLLSAPPFYGEADPAAILAGVSVPSLHVTTTEDEILIPGYNSPPSDRIAVYQAMGSDDKALAVFVGGGHSIFTDRTGPGGPELNAKVKQATRELALDWMQDLWRGGPPRLPAWRERYSGVLAQFEHRLRL